MDRARPVEQSSSDRMFADRLGDRPVLPSCPDGGAPLAGFHVTIAGSASGDGSLTKPWNLSTALLGPAAVKPGDTIWVHGGLYAGAFVSKLTGAAGAPITVRAVPGERVTLDGKGATNPVLQVYKAFTVLRDLEITNSDTTRVGSSRPSGIYVEGKNISLQHLVVHDVGTGIICNSASATTAELAPELEIYGCLLYNNGWDDTDRSHGHHLYIQNRDGTKHILENILASSFGFGVHAYSDTDSYWTQGYEIAGNVWFNSGAASSVNEAGGTTSKLYDGCMVGHNGTHPVERLVLRENMGWARGAGERDLRLGWAAPNTDAKLEGNYIVGTTIFQPSWQTVVMNGNTFYGAVTGVDTSKHPNNTYLTARPQGAKIFVRPSKVEPGRAHIVIYNWDGAASVAVDVSGVLAAGASYEVRSAQDLYGAPVASGTYGGGTIALPMTGLGAAQPVGLPQAIAPGEMTGKELQVFVLLPRTCAP
jgi:hypothetical protein